MVTGHRGECTAWELSVLGWAAGSLGLWVLSRGEAGMGWSVEENEGGARSDGGAGPVPSGQDPPTPTPWRQVLPPSAWRDRQRPGVRLVLA